MMKKKLKISKMVRKNIWAIDNYIQDIRKQAIQRLVKDSEDKDEWDED
jgi:hypothetical protein